MPSNYILATENPIDYNLITSPIYYYDSILHPDHSFVNTTNIDWPALSADIGWSAWLTSAESDVWDRGRTLWLIQRQTVMLADCHIPWWWGMVSKLSATLLNLASILLKLAKTHLICLCVALRRVPRSGHLHRSKQYNVLERTKKCILNIKINYAHRAYVLLPSLTAALLSMQPNSRCILAWGSIYATLFYTYHVVQHSPPW